MQGRECINLKMMCKLIKKQWYRIIRRNNKRKLVRERQYRIIRKWYEKEVAKGNQKEQVSREQRRRLSYGKQYYKEPEFYRYDAYSNYEYESDKEDLSGATSMETMDQSTSYRDDLDDVEIVRGSYSKLKRFVIPREDSRKEEKSSSYSSFGYLSDYWDAYNKEEWEEEIFLIDEDIQIKEKKTEIDEEKNWHKISFSDKIRYNNESEFIRSKL